MHCAWLSRFAPCGGELEKARRAICTASVGPFTRQMVQNDGEIAHSADFLWHGPLPFVSCVASGLGVAGCVGRGNSLSPYSCSQCSMSRVLRSGWPEPLLRGRAFSQGSFRKANQCALALCLLDRSLCEQCGVFDAVRDQTGSALDQAVLYGTLLKIHHLGTTLLSVNPIASPSEDASRS